jgi:hypothetical protein
VELVESLGGDEPAATLADEGGGAEECGGSVESAVGWQAVWEEMHVEEQPIDECNGPSTDVLGGCFTGNCCGTLIFLG